MIVCCNNLTPPYLEATILPDQNVRTLDVSVENVVLVEELEP